MVSSTPKRRETPHLLEFSSSERRARSYRETTKLELFGKSRERRRLDGNSSISVSRWSCSRPDMPLAEVALTIGFPNQAYFSTVFKKYTGETPKRWRDLARRPAPPSLVLTNMSSKTLSWSSE